MRHDKDLAACPCVRGAIVAVDPAASALHALLGRRWLTDSRCCLVRANRCASSLEALAPSRTSAGPTQHPLAAIDAARHPRASPRLPGAMSFQRKLQALEYPEAVTGRVSSGNYASLESPAFRTLVVWLEFTKIRFRPVDQRGALKAIDAPEWNQTFVQYLVDLDCPRQFAAQGMSPDAVGVVLDWLLSQAVGAEYADHAGEYNSLSRMWFISGDAGGAGGKHATSHSSTAGAVGSALASSSSSGASGSVTLDCASAPALRAEFEGEVRELARMFQLPFDPTRLATILRVIRKRVEEAIVAAAAAAGRTAPPTLHPASAAAAAAPARGASAQPASALPPSSSSSKSKSTRFVHTVEQPPLPQTREEVFAVLDRMELGFQKTGGQHTERGEGGWASGRRARSERVSTHADVLCSVSVCPVLLPPPLPLPDELVDHAAQVFRLLFLHDLRSAQNLSNELTALAQEYTSDPKTDAKLGKVGV